MKTKLITLISISAVSLGLNACMMHDDTALDNAPGKYERTTSTTNAAGTRTERETSTDVGYDSYGNKKAVVKTKTTTDPKGLLNKTTNSKTKQVIEERY